MKPTAAIAVAIASLSVLPGQTLTAPLGPETLAASAPAPEPARGKPPLGATGRVQWAIKGALGLDSLFANAAISGIGTAADVPKEYGVHWDGFGRRYGSRLLNGATSVAFEATAGSFWGEDPRYTRATGQPVKSRLKHVVVSAFIAHDRQGHAMPAYSRYLAYTGTSFLSNEWRPPSETSLGDTLARIPMSFATRMAKNAFSEFYPDFRRRIFHKGDSN